jgi:hypothetical protein
VDVPQSENVNERGTADDSLNEFVAWPDIEQAIFKAARRGKTVSEFAKFWGVTVCAARARLVKLVIRR